MANLLYGKQLANALGKDGSSKDFKRVWKVAIQAVVAMLRFKSGLSGWSQRADPRSKNAVVDHTLKGFHTLPPTPLRRLQKELPPDTVKLVLHGLKGELLMGPDVVSLKVHISQIKKRLEVHARNEVIKGRLSRALQLYSFIALGAVVHLLHRRRAVDDMETLRMLQSEQAETGDGTFSPDTLARLAQVASAMPPSPNSRGAVATESNRAICQQNGLNSLQWSSSTCMGLWPGVILLQVVRSPYRCRSVSALGSPLQWEIPAPSQLLDSKVLSQPGATLPAVGIPGW